MNIRKYFLVTDTHRENPNPGDILIRNGIEYLLREAEKKLDNIPIFRYMSIFGVDERIWNDAFEEADYIVICGTPQLGYSPTNHFDRIYSMIQKAEEKGIITANLGMGAGGHDQYYDIEKTASEIYEIHKNRKLQLLKHFDLITTRDAIMEKVLQKSGVECTRFIDTVFYAKDYFGIDRNESSLNIITLKGTNLDLRHTVAEQIRKIKLDQSRPTIYLCHDLADYEVYKNLLDKDKLFCVNDPKSLITLYSRANQVVSMKMHGSVPTLSFGNEVANICMDCRSNILECVGVQSIKFDEFVNKGTYKFQHVPQIDELKEYEKARFIQLWHDKCQKKYGEKKVKQASKYCSESYWSGDGSSGYDGIIKTVDGTVKKILNKIIELKPKSILELGCASGSSVNYFSQAGLISAGIDISDYAIQEGQKRYLVDIRSGSIHKLPYNDRSFDMVYSQQVLEHVPTELVVDLLKEIKRVVQIGGVVLLYLVIGYKGQVGKADSDVDKTHWNLKTKEWWLNECSKEGLREDKELDEIFEEAIPYEKLHRLTLRRTK